MNKSPQFSPEIHERAVRMVYEHREECPSLWAAVESLAPKISCVSNTLYEWMCKYLVDSGTRHGTTTSDQNRLKELERENLELRKANEILKLARAFFAQAEIDRRLKS
jgi:transposase-like protein